VIERKSYGRPPSALVIEADYRDFLDPARLAGRWPAAHVARSGAVAESAGA
jgi:hypothetical protein